MAAISGKKAYDPKLHITESGHATPRTAARPGTALEDFIHDNKRPVIAIDMDDVLSQTNEAVMECEYLEEAQWEIPNEMRSRANAQAGGRAQRHVRHEDDA